MEWADGVGEGGGGGQGCHALSLRGRQRLGSSGRRQQVHSLMLYLCIAYALLMFHWIYWCFTLVGEEGARRLEWEEAASHALRSRGGRGDRPG
jgi:hypothetical protein